MHPESHWNYRVCTHVEEKDNQRYFSIKEIHYKNNIPIAYGDKKEFLDYIEDLEAVKWTLEQMQEALNKPIIDLDNFPNEYL